MQLMGISKDFFLISIYHFWGRKYLVIRIIMYEYHLASRKFRNFPRMKFYFPNYVSIDQESHKLQCCWFGFGSGQ